MLDEPLESVRVLVTSKRVILPALMPAIFLNGVSRSMNMIPMLNIWTPPPDMYNMKACIGRDFAGEIAKSHAREALRFA
jgi:hypothetical protein